MRKTALLPASLSVGILALGLTLAGCSSTPAASPTTPDTMASSSSTPMPSSSPAMADMKTGAFMGLNGKNVKGTATIEGSDLKLTGFSSDEGPDLHIYLTTGTDEAAVSAGKEISTVVFNQDAQSFMLSGVDASMYTNVVIHCDKAKAVFGAAPLS